MIVVWRESDCKREDGIAVRHGSEGGAIVAANSSGTLFFIQSTPGKASAYDDERDSRSLRASKERRVSKVATREMRKEKKQLQLTI